MKWINFDRTVKIHRDYTNNLEKELIELKEEGQYGKVRE